MIRPLRRRHRWMTTALAVLLPVVLLAAHGARRSDPLATGRSGGAPLGSAVALPVAAAEWMTLDAARARLASTGDGLVLQLEGASEIAAPDLRLYWVAPGGEPASGALLGAVPATGTGVFPLAEPVPGEVLLYSLAHGRIVARAALQAPGGPP